MPQNMSDDVVILQKFGKICATYGECVDCPISAIKQADKACVELMRDDPEGFAKIVSGVSDDSTFYSEFHRRFPLCNLSLEAVANGFCRDALFSGEVTCQDTSHCQECWAMQYKNDSTLPHTWSTGADAEASETDIMSELFD